MKRDADPVRERLVLLPDQLRQVPGGVPVVDQDLVMMRSQVSGDQPRRFDLAQVLVLGEPDGERLERTIELLGHQGGDQ